MIGEIYRVSFIGHRQIDRFRFAEEHSDLLVAYVERDSGGAAVCLKKAEKTGIAIKNIALEEE